MAQKTTYLSDKLLDHVLRNTSFTPPTVWYAALFTEAPTDAYTPGVPTGTELAGFGYTRQAVTFSTAAGAATANTNTVTFGPASASWGTIVALGLFDASTNGNLLYWNSLTTQLNIASTESVVFPPGDIVVGED